jgi:hypothetical protein
MPKAKTTKKATKPKAVKETPAKAKSCDKPAKTSTASVRLSW